MEEGHDTREPRIVEVQRLKLAQKARALEMATKDTERLCKED
jgi:hypothetical protein